MRNLDQGHHNRHRSYWPDFTLTNVALVILILVVILMGAYIVKPDYFKKIIGKSAQTATKSEPKQEPQAKSSGYSAVFLLNNQVYFGKLTDLNSQYMKLREVYYLRVDRPLQPPPATESAQPDVQLVKLGNELHGPVDEIKFNRDQVLYIEDLKSDSRIVKAIEEFKGRNK